MRTASTNRKVVLASRPDGLPDESHFRIEEAPLQELADGEVRVAVDTISIDAFIRTTLNEESYHLSVPVGGTVGALAVGRVTETAAPHIDVGDGVFGPLGAQTVATVAATSVQRVDENPAPLTAYLGPLGLTTGLTAYIGICEVARVAAGETVVVSGAAGGVGSMAGQIAKLEGAGTVIGIAGGAAKVEYLTSELGYDHGVDYKGEDVAARLRQLAPDGIDVYFDNVGGPLLDIALDQIRDRARVVICGAISQYGHMDDVRGPTKYLRLAERRARMEGFAVTHELDRLPAATERLATWLAEDRIRLPEHVIHGIEEFPAALRTLFEGGHMGKLLLKV